jgi:low temperature requirement protein LtrA
MGIRVGEPVGTNGRVAWLVPPRLRTTEGRDAERHASWLELFFDLIFVVAITELSRLLVVDHSAGGFLRFAALFVPVYVAWQGYMAYATRFDTDDLAFRVTYFAAMLAIAAMPVLIADVARGIHTAAFAVAYVVLRSLMLALYARAWFAVPQARRLVRFYGIGYSVGVAIWLAPLAVLYYDRQEGVALRGSTMSVVVYSYAHIPLLLGLAAMGAGLRLLIERAHDDRLGTGPSVAPLGGAALFLLSLILVVLVAQAAIPPVALAGALAGILIAVVYVDRMLLGAPR